MLVLSPGTRTRCVAYSPDGRTLATGGADGTLRLWDLAAGTTRLIIAASEFPIMRVAWSLDGSLIFATDFNGRIRAWNTQSGATFEQLEGATPRTILEWIERPITPNDTNWSLAEATVVFQPFSANFPDITDQRWRHADAAGWHLSRASARQIYHWNQSAGPGDDYAHNAILAYRGTFFPHQGQLERIRLSLIGAVEHWWIPMSSGSIRLGTYLPGAGSVMDNSTHSLIARSPDDMTMAIVRGEEIWICNFDRDALERSGEIPLERSGGVLIQNPELVGPMWASRSFQGRIGSLQGHTKQVRALTFHPDGRTLLSGGHDGLVCLWDLGEGGDGEPRRFDWEIGLIDAVAFAPDGATAAAGGRKGIVVWDVEEGQWT